RAPFDCEGSRDLRARSALEQLNVPSITREPSSAIWRGFGNSHKRLKQRLPCALATSSSWQDRSVITSYRGSFKLRGRSNSERWRKGQRLTWMVQRKAGVGRRQSEPAQRDTDYHCC